MTQHYGVDCSSNNSHPMNWAAIFSYLYGLGGAQPFAIIKITQGTGYTNPYAIQDIADAKAAGFAVGGYLMDEGSADPAAEEALYRRLTGVPQFDDDELPDGLTDAQYIAHLQGLIAQQPAIQYLNQSEVASGYPQGSGLWLAQYNNTPGVTKYPCIIHQYNDVGVIPGCAGEFDLNVWCGTETQFSQTFGTAPSPSPSTPKEGPSMLSEIITTANGTDHIFQCHPWTTLIHFWREPGQFWANAANELLGSTGFVYPQTPNVRYENGTLEVTAEMSNGNGMYFSQDDNRKPTDPNWGENTVGRG